MNAIRISVWTLAVALAVGVHGGAEAADAVRGKALFASTNGSPQSCGSASCHSGFPSVTRNGITKGSNPNTILSAINGNTGGMGVLKPYVNATDAADIAAYIANPNAATGAPSISLSATTLTFASQTTATTSAPQVVTVSNTGTAALSIASIALSGTAAGDFAKVGTCQNGTNVAAGGSCTVQITFTPAATGARSATLTITHNAGGGTSTVSLNGTGAAAPAVASIAPMTLSFTQTLNTTSNAQAVTVTNTGGQPLTLGAIGLSGTNAVEFSIGATSTCTMGTVLNATASCNLQITFRPTAAGARSATLSIAHSATGSPAAISLNGTGTVVAVPAISLSVSTLTFGSVSLGGKSTAQTVTLTNSGQAPLTISALTLSGPASGDFALGGTCSNGMMVASGATCSLQLLFGPSVVGARGATLTVTSNASNGNPSVALSGTGVQYAISISPSAADLQATMGTTSSTSQALLTNSGASPITITSIAITGPFVLQQGTNGCGQGPIDLTPGQSCNIYFAFQPAATGAASGEILIATAALATATRVALTAMATSAQSDVSTPTSPSSPGAAPPGGSAALAPTNAGGGGCTVGPADQLVDPLLAGMLAVALFGALRQRSRSRMRADRE